LGAIDVQSWQKAAIRVGVPAVYAMQSFTMLALLAENLDAHRVVAAKLFQPMFTIRFLDDSYPTARSFFASQASRLGCPMSVEAPCSIPTLCCSAMPKEPMWMLDPSVKASVWSFRQL
jgi:hypothetical protein